MHILPPGPCTPLSSRNLPVEIRRREERTTLQQPIQALVGCSIVHAHKTLLTSSDRKNLQLRKIAQVRSTPSSISCVERDRSICQTGVQRSELIVPRNACVGGLRPAPAHTQSECDVALRGVDLEDRFYFIEDVEDVAEVQDAGLRHARLREELCKGSLSKLVDKVARVGIGRA